MGRLKLFGDADGDNNEISKIEINKEFAKRYQHNKEREDLQRYEELAKKGQIQESDSDSSSSDEEEEFPDIFDPSYKKDIEFFENLLKVKNRDPCLYRPGEHLFKSESDEGESDTDDESKKENQKEKKKKAMYAKDVIAQHLLEEGPEFGETESSEMSRMKKSYSEEQEDLRREFLDAVKNDEGENGEDDEFLRVKEKKLEADHEGSGYEELKNKLDEYFGRDEELDEGNKFLKDFFLNKRWLGKEGKGEKNVVKQSELDELLRDEEELERQEEYERKYNFRFEENAGDRVMGHSRKIEGSVRKKENTRKEQRKSKEERMKIAEQERKEELKHLKNLKKKEMKKNLEKLMEVAGIEGDVDCPFDLDGLGDDFDPEEYDKLMKKAFNEKYYEMEDPNPDFGSGADEDGDIEKPDFDKEDELLGLPKDWDVLDSGDGFLAAREKSLKLKKVNDSDNEEEKDDEDNDNEDDEVSGEEKSSESKRKRKRKMSLVKKAREEMMEEYYKLDYEDTIGDLKTRFKYAKVKPNRYGLKTEEILMMNDKELNQFVSVKKLMPYREREWKLPNSKRYQLKMRAKEVVRGISKDQISSKKRRLNKGDRSTPTVDSDQNGKPEPESSVDMGNLSRKAKKRQRKAELKLSHSRRLAYGEIQSSTKRKGN